jgi:hypothetical protein
MHQPVSVVKVYSPHYLKRVSVCFWEPVKCLGGQPFTICVVWLRCSTVSLDSRLPTFRCVILCQLAWVAGL